ncbi:hypothetical protein [Chryseobacterium tongliaoense]|uniref:hypothetical protein n=1 Tax=Chryseobacterium tongliaoense TaxID=3240933 RepID=UPI003517DC20
MIRNLLILLSLFLVSGVSGQNREGRKPKMDFYVNPTLNVGYNLGNSIKDNQNKDSPYYQQYISPYLPNKITYGLTVVGGYNFLPNFALGTGLKYSFIDDNFHMMYWVIQPKFIFGPGDEPFFIDASYGKQINHSAVSNSNFWGLKLGKQISFSKRLSQEGGLVLESHEFKNSSSLFIGISYGITLFSNKDYTGYGQD